MYVDDTYHRHIPVIVLLPLQTLLLTSSFAAVITAIDTGRDKLLSQSTRVVIFLICSIFRFHVELTSMSGAGEDDDGVIA